MRRAHLPIVLVSLAARAPTGNATESPSGEPSSAEPSGIGLGTAPAPNPTALPHTIAFAPSFAGPALRTIELMDGVRAEVVHEGVGPHVVHGQAAQIRFDGFASADGHVVVGSRGEPTTFVLADSAGEGELRTSMVEAVVGMCVGERRRVRVPASLAATQIHASDQQVGDVWITVELLGFEDPPTLATIEDFDGPPIASEIRDGGLEVYDYGLGEGTPADSDDAVEVHYILTLTDGVVIDSTHARAQSFLVELGANMVIPGFDAGLVGATPGMLRKLVIPPALAYADRETGTIPADSTLIFYLEVVSVDPRPNG